MKHRMYSAYRVAVVFLGIYGTYQIFGALYVGPKPDLIHVYLKGQQHAPSHEPSTGAYQQCYDDPDNPDAPCDRDCWERCIGSNDGCPR